MTPEMIKESYERLDKTVLTLSRAIGTVRYDSSASIPNLEDLIKQALKDERNMMIKDFNAKILKITTAHDFINNFYGPDADGDVEKAREDLGKFIMEAQVREEL